MSSRSADRSPSHTSSAVQLVLPMPATPPPRRRESVTDDTAAQTPDAALALSLLHSMSGRSAEAVATVDKVLSQSALPAEMRARGVCSRLLAGLLVGDVEASRRLAEEILAGDRRSDDDTTLGGALTALGLVAWERGRAEDALGLLGAAVRRMGRTCACLRFLRPELELADKYVALGDLHEADAIISRADWEINATGDGAWSAATMLARARLDLATGDLRRALRQALVAQDLAREMGARVFVTDARWVCAAVAVRRGDLAEAEGYVAWWRSAPTATTRRDRGAWILLEACLAVARGGPTAVTQVLADVHRCPQAHRGLLLTHPGATALLVRTALAVADRDTAEAVSACARQLAGDNPSVPVIGAAADHADGLLRGSVDLLVKAARGYRDPWARGSAYEDAGIVASDDNDDSRARAMLGSALSAYRQSGAIRDVRRVNAALRALRTTRRARRATRPVSGWASLTAAERRVADVVAEGVTNGEAADRLFVSRHTVDFHLRQIFRKLGISSRVELARMVGERSDDPPDRVASHHRRPERARLGLEGV